MSLSVEYAGQVRDVVVAQLEDSSRGLNVQLAVTMAAAGLTPFVLDFGPASASFFEAAIDPEELEASTPIKYPIATLAVIEEVNSLDQTFITFSGSVPMELVIYVSFIQSGIPRNVEKTLNAVSAAVIRTFCDGSAAASANFTGPVTFNRKMTVKRSRPQMGAQNWRAALRCVFSCGLDTQ